MAATGKIYSLRKRGSLVHPLICSTEDRNGQSLLHLAVKQNQDQWTRFLIKRVSLRQRKNQYGVTPLELARFLHRMHQTALLGDPPISFPPYVSIPKIPAGPFSYLPYPVFEKPGFLEEILENTQKAKKEDLIPQEKIWMGVYFAKDVQGGSSPRLSIRHVDESIGFGLFADQKIPSCAFIGEYTGIIKERKKSDLKDKIYCVRYTDWHPRSRKFVIDAETHGNYTQFINHSAQPNLALQSVYLEGIPRMLFVSLKEIPEGCQLTFDYGDLFWKQLGRRPKLIM